MPLGRVLPHKTNSLGQLAQRHVVLCLFADGVVQHSGVVPRRRKLQRHRVALTGTHMGIAAAGHHQHQRALPEMRHDLHALPQVERQRTAAGQFQLLKLHLRILLIEAVPPLRVDCDKFCA